MEVRKLIVKDVQKLFKFLENQPAMSYAKVQKLFRNKDVKVNGRRETKNILLKAGDVVEFYLKKDNLRIIYEDKDIVVVFKPRKIETINDAGEDLMTLVEKQIDCKVYAVHRLDCNTEGLVVFAKNFEAKQSLDNVIKNRLLDKYYLAKVVGVPANRLAKLVAYLKKDKERSRVFISNVKIAGYEEIQTNYEVIEDDGEFALLNIKLVTGKTHQIRAHLSHVGYPILGDDKYGNFKVNKQEGKRYQCLTAYKLVFHFDKDDYLSKLDGLNLELDKKEIKF